MTPEALKELRRRLGLTQQGMADRLGVHLRTYQQWEYGRRKPRAAAVRLIELTFPRTGEPL